MRSIIAGLAFVVACGPTVPNHGDGDGGDSDSADDGDSDAMDGADGTDDATDVDAPAEPDAAVCGAQMQNIGVVNLGDPPDLLVVLDRSGSMSEFPPVFPPVFNTKWNIMRDALKSIVMTKQQSIKFGLLEFPSDENCASDASAEVGVMLGSYPQFNSYFGGRSPGGNTPAHVALTSALTYYNGIAVNPAGRFALFATDGLPNCSGGNPDTASNAETVAAVTALRNAGINTYVLGFGSFADPTVLNDAAVAGGVPRPGSVKYYEANDAASLDMALQAIAGGIIVPSCTFQLQSAPPVPEDVTVMLNGAVVPRSPSHGDGWDYYPDAMTITFFGSYCEAIEMGASTDVSFSYGCPGPVIQ